LRVAGSVQPADHILQNTVATAGIRLIATQGTTCGSRVSSEATDSSAVANFTRAGSLSAATLLELSAIPATLHRRLHRSPSGCHLVLVHLAQGLCPAAGSRACRRLSRSYGWYLNACGDARRTLRQVSLPGRSRYRPSRERANSAEGRAWHRRARAFLLCPPDSCWNRCGAEVVRGVPAADGNDAPP
jgi:hypothetical protein